MAPTATFTKEPVASDSAHKGKLATIDLSEYDPEQSKLMDERCIIVDEQDNAIGALDKKTCASGRVACQVPRANILPMLQVT